MTTTASHSTPEPSSLSSTAPATTTSQSTPVPSTLARVQMPSNPRNSSLPPVVDLTQPTSTNTNQRQGPFTNITQRVLGHLFPPTTRKSLLSTPSTNKTSTMPNMTCQMQGFLSSSAGATKPCKPGTPSPRFLFTPRTSTGTRPLFATPATTPRPLLTPTTSAPPRSRPTPLTTLSTTTHPSCPAAQFWWCVRQDCGRSNPVKTSYCGYCGTARAIARKRSAGN